MDSHLLGIYLNDHLAGSVVGTRLVHRIAKHNEGNQYGSEATQLAREIEEDKVTLEALMDRLGVDKKKPRLAIAAVGETLGRFLPNGRLLGYSPLSRVIELEALMLGISGKLELWKSLKVTDVRVGAIDVDELIQRAQEQRDRVRDLRLQAAREAFRGDFSS
jgi:hypothetical protein